MRMRAPARMRGTEREQRENPPLLKNPAELEKPPLTGPQRNEAALFAWGAQTKPPLLAIHQRRGIFYPLKSGNRFGGSNYWKIRGSRANAYIYLYAPNLGGYPVPDGTHFGARFLKR